MSERLGAPRVPGILTDEHLDDTLPSLESLDKDVGRLQLMRGGILLDLCLNQLDVYSRRCARHTKDWFLETVEPALDVVRETVSKWDISCWCAIRVGVLRDNGDRKRKEDGC